MGLNHIIMKNFILFFSSTFLFINVQAFEFQSIRSDINSGLLPVETAKRAHANKMASQNAVKQLVNSNVDVVKAVQTVAKQWSSCSDTYASVKQGVKLAPNRAGEIVASIANISGCKCNAQSFWARSKLEQRLRPRINRALVEISSTCSCASAGIEAAMEIVPNQVEDMIDAVIVAKNRAEHTEDSIGQIGVLPEQKFWGSNLIKTKDTNLVRGNDVCDGDHDEMDRFNPEDSWTNQGSIDDLGSHKPRCRNDDSDDETSKSFTTNKLIISQYVEGDGSNQALEIYNKSDKAIDLLTNNYQLEVYFHGYDFPGEVIQLKGKIEPQSTFVISDAKANREIRSNTNQKVNGLVFKGADAVVLKTGFNNNPCQCSTSTVASAINGFSKQIDSNIPKSIESKKQFIKRIEQHYGNTGIQTTVIDSIGRILVNKDKDSVNDRPIVVDKTLRRYESICKGDRMEMDDFAVSTEWDENHVDDFTGTGYFQEKDCLATRNDVLLSEYIEGTGNNASLELFNGTNRPIDLANEKYFLEIYNNDDDIADEKIYLKGMLNRNDVFVVANDSADQELKSKANQSAGNLNLANARAVVLKKVVIPAYQSCYADIADWVVANKGLFSDDKPIKNVTYTLTPIYDPGTGPVTDDDPRDGDDGGELASPN